jgi:hypothetical protein
MRNWQGKMFQSRNDPQRRPASKVQGTSRSFHLMEMKWTVERITQVYFVGTSTHTRVKTLLVGHIALFICGTGTNKTWNDCLLIYQGGGIKSDGRCKWDVSWRNQSCDVTDRYRRRLFKPVREGTPLLVHLYLASLDSFLNSTDLHNASRWTLTKPLVSRDHGFNIFPQKCQKHFPNAAFWRRVM